MKMPGSTVTHQTGRGGADANGRRSSLGISPQGCDWLRCAVVVADCVSECSSGIANPRCVRCLGNSYNACKDCF